MLRMKFALGCFLTLGAGICRAYMAQIRSMLQLVCSAPDDTHLPAVGAVADTISEDVIQAGNGFGAGFAASGTPVDLASLGLPTCHRQQSRWRWRGNLIVVHV
jgi:hypothetical protein